MQGQNVKLPKVGRVTALPRRPHIHCTAIGSTSTPPQGRTYHADGFDLILSSGFLAFASHAGFLAAVEEVGLPVRGVMGTSSGAITGALFAAGYSAEEIARELGRLPPIKRIKLSKRPWRGLLSLDPAMKELSGLLPGSFEELEGDFAVGVVGLGRRTHAEDKHEFIDTGSLPQAIVASAAVPVLFSPVRIPTADNNPYMDGGVACRIGLQLWRQNRTEVGEEPNPAAVHLIGRSTPFSGNDSLENLGAKLIIICLRIRGSVYLFTYFSICVFLCRKTCISGV